jgi:hypothetical protein
LTWAEKETDNVSLSITGNEKAPIAVSASITADGVKLPLYPLAHGKMKRAEISQSGHVASHISDHSESGWPTGATMMCYLEWL